MVTVRAKLSLCLLGFVEEKELCVHLLAFFHIGMVQTAKIRARKNQAYILYM